MMTSSIAITRNAWVSALFLAALLQTAAGFQIPHAGHQHPLYVRYRQEHLDEQSRQQGHVNTRHGPHSQTPCASDIIKTQGSAFAMSEEGFATFDTSGMAISSNAAVEAEISISTPVSYDEETGMVQTAVRAIVRHPVSSLVDNDLVGFSSTMVIATSALTEVAHCIQLEFTHHAATGSTESLAILSMGHFFHYGREAIKQLIEISEQAKKSEDDSSRDS